MKNRQIKESGWRWWLAQRVLGLLYGRKYHYISPWQNAGIAGAIVFFNAGKVLLQLRGGGVEYSGTWGLPGGYCNLGSGESLPETAVREVMEELGITFSAQELPQHVLPYYRLVQGHDKNERAKFNWLSGYYDADFPADQLDKLQALDEVDDLRWFTMDEVKELKTQNKLSPFDTYGAVRHLAQQRGIW